MLPIKKVFGVLVFCYFILIPGLGLADEYDLFSYTANPDALILLDLSGSMDDTPSGGSGSSTTSKLALAKKAIKAILDDNSSNTINSTDEESLRIRIGYMRFYSCYADDTGGSYSSGCNSLRNAIPGTDPPPFSSPSRYSDVWSSVSGESAVGGTPLASAMSEAKLYLDAHKATDAGSSCRQKFVILITDGEDTYACNGNGTDSQSDMYKRRKASVKEAKALNDAGYKIFVVGFGATMPATLKNTLNWMAYHGGTNNPSTEQSGDTTAITPSADPCNEGSSNDPSGVEITGYAFLATNATELGDAVARAFDYINSSRVSFTASSVAAFRTASENYLYETSFQPVNGDPFWLGHIKKYAINTDGSIDTSSPIWDAGTMLQAKSYNDRQIFTLRSGAIVSLVHGNFSAPGQYDTYLALTSSTKAQSVIGYIRGNPTYNKENWKLGDIFHSNTIAIGSPSVYFTDIRSPQSFIDFRSSHASRERILVAGANDGQFRAFSASDGSEKWSFIPPNQLPRLKFITHSTEPTTLAHKYFADGGVTVADVWLGSGDGTSKSSADWHTLLVFGEGKGVRDSTNDYPSFLWSSVSSCDQDFSKTYSGTYQNYCGYYALDLTDTSAVTPVIKWLLNFSAGSPQTQQYLGEPWAKMVIGKVKISGNEKWVGFIGGGYGTEADLGKGIFVVDLSDGHVLWSYTKADNASLDYAVPAPPTIVDADSDGFIDTAYVGDLGGNMWRLKFCTQADTSCSTSNWSGGLLFQASGGRPVYFSATAARDANSLWVYWGTGNREAPLTTTGPDKFFAVKDNDRTATYTISNLQALSTIWDPINYPNGWYLTLPGSGEKILADPTVFGGIVLFTTYTPDTTSSNICARVGTAKLYGMAMMDLTIAGITYAVGAGVLSAGTAGTTTGGAKSTTIGTGLAKEPVLSQKPAPGGSTDLYITVSGGIGGNTSIVTAIALGANPLTDRLQSTAPSTQVIHWNDRRLQ